MNYREEVRDLFSVPEEYFLAHCISADFAMGKGIVLEFNKRFDMKRQLRQKYPWPDTSKTPPAATVSWKGGC